MHKSDYAAVAEKEQFERDAQRERAQYEEYRRRAESNTVRSEPDERVNAIGWRDDPRRDVPQVAVEIERLHKVSCAYRKLLEELESRLQCVTVSTPALREDIGNGHPEAPLCPVARSIRESTLRFEEGNVILRGLLSSLGI